MCATPCQIRFHSRLDHWWAQHYEDQSSPSFVCVCAAVCKLVVIVFGCHRELVRAVVAIVLVVDDFFTKAELVVVLIVVLIVAEVVVDEDCAGGDKPF